MRAGAAPRHRPVFDELAPLTPGTSDSLSTNQTWYELRRTAAPCVYVEAEFHDNAKRPAGS